MTHHHQDHQPSSPVPDPGLNKEDLPMPLGPMIKQLLGDRPGNPGRETGPCSESSWHIYEHLPPFTHEITHIPHMDYLGTRIAFGFKGCCNLMLITPIIHAIIWFPLFPICLHESNSCWLRCVEITPYFPKMWSL